MNTAIGPGGWTHITAPLSGLPVCGAILTDNIHQPLGPCPDCSEWWQLLQEAVDEQWLATR